MLSLGLGFSFFGGGSRARTPGAKQADDVNTPTISRSWYPRHAINSVITVSGLTFQQWTGSTWTNAASEGTLDYPKIRVTANSSTEYETTTTPTITIDGTEYVFYVTTPVDPTNRLLFGEETVLLGEDEIIY